MARSSKSSVQPFVPSDHEHAGRGPMESVLVRLAVQVLSLAPFAQVSQEQYRTFLLHLIEIKHLERMETGTLVIGLQGEKIVNNYRFYATFEDETGFRVVEQDLVKSAQCRQRLRLRPPFGLAGFTWRVVAVDEERRMIFFLLYVQRARGKPQMVWVGGGIHIHSRIVQKTRQVLQEKVTYPYLHADAVQRLEHARGYAAEIELTSRSLIPLGGTRYLVLPWQGTRIVETQKLLLAYAGLQVSDAAVPYCYRVHNGSESLEEFRRQVQAIAEHPPKPEELVSELPTSALLRNKYDRYVEESLLRQAYGVDTLDMDGATETPVQIVCGPRKVAKTRRYPTAAHDDDSITTTSDVMTAIVLAQGLQGRHSSMPRPRRDTFAAVHNCTARLPIGLWTAVRNKVVSNRLTDFKPLPERISGLVVQGNRHLCATPFDAIRVARRGVLLFRM